jgi:hypothetical protein
MTPIDQTIFEDGRGDCLRACVASILGLSAADVPNFSEDKSYAHGAAVFLRKRGYTVLRIDWTGDGYTHEQYVSCLEARCILSGWSPRRNSDGTRRQHAVVGRANGWSFVVDHDPHPSRAGIVGQPISVMWVFRPV